MKKVLMLLMAFTILTLPVAAQDFGSISGTVTIGERALEGAVVMVWALNDPNGGNHGRPQVAETDENGEYAFERVIAGRAVVQAQAPFGGQPQSQNVEVAAGHNTVVNFHFDDQHQDDVGAVFGRVIIGDNPAPNVTVMLLPPDHNGGDRMYSTQTNRDGNYRIANVVAGPYIARAIGGFGQVAEQEIEVVADEELEVNFELQGGDDDHGLGSVEGTVTDPDGNAIQRADVIVSARVMGGGNNGGREHMINLMTHTDAEGHYRIDDVPAGLDLIAAGKFGYVPFHGEVEIVADEVVEFDIVLEPVQHEDLVFGSVFGAVTDADGAGIPEAHVLLVPHGDRNGNHHGDDPMNRRGQMVTFTDEEGNYVFDEVPVGDYLARAAKRGFAPADQQIAVAEEEATEANFVLQADEHGGGGGNHGGGGHHDGERVELHGLAIVIEGDVADIYLLDTDEDGAADYLLNFGPPDYDPGNGAARPESGDEIDIVGLTAGHMEPPMVLVFEINGQLWRDPNGDDHGGRPGGGNGWDGEGELELVDAEGTVAVRPDSPWYHRYFLNINDDAHPEFVLFFGEDDYDPGNGVERPENGDFVNIVGGMFQPRNGLPVIVVYQLNGQFWREPGDTRQLFWEDPNSVGGNEPLAPASPILLGAYPNPFNPKATVSFSLAEAMKVRVSVIDLTGREVALLAAGEMGAGNHLLTLDGSGIKAGTYFLRIETPAGGVVEKVTLLR